VKSVPLNENIDYPSPESEAKSEHHLIVCEIATRLQELDSHQSGIGAKIPLGVRLINRLSAIQRRSHRAYILLIDLLSSQESLSMSLESLASRHTNAQLSPTKRQAWLQNMQKDIDIISESYPEIAYALTEIMRRRHHPDSPTKS
jgi:hypothetical protein